MLNPNEIDKDKYYTASEVSRMKILPWVSKMTFTKILMDPYWAEIFNPIVEKKKTSRRFYIQGVNIIKFLELAKEGKLK